ncbi:MAG TPA: hypothetical protein DD636_09590, partial [Anaerolineaceae bacterium]|nr:hypothetical protein [Anaerolineaceae bacterium]
MDDADMGSWSYAYDALGNLVSQKDAKGQQTCLYYDMFNRLVGKSYGTCNGITPVQYRYYDEGTDQNGYRTGMTDPSGSTSWSYDLRGRLGSIQT